MSSLAPLSSPLARIEQRISPLRSALLGHEVYQRLDRIAALRIFMEHHVFAVWDFMSLLKALQRRFTCVDVPWVPAPSDKAARFINEIVLGEECDEDGRGGYASHFELYRQAMRQFGADTGPIDSLNDSLRAGGALDVALSSPQIPAAAQRFVRDTFDVIASGDAAAILSAFTFGREDLLPSVFQRIVDELNVESGSGLADFQYYLNRHIALDGDEHGPMAQRLLELVCGQDDSQWRSVEEAAVRSLESRLALWNGIRDAIGA